MILNLYWKYLHLFSVFSYLNSILQPIYTYLKNIHVGFGQLKIERVEHRVKQRNTFLNPISVTVWEHQCVQERVRCSRTQGVKKGVRKVFLYLTRCSKYRLFVRPSKPVYRVFKKTSKNRVRLQLSRSCDGLPASILNRLLKLINIMNMMKEKSYLIKI